MFLFGIFAVLGYIAYKGIEVSEENANNKAMGGVGGASDKQVWTDPATGLPPPPPVENPPGWPTSGYPSAVECEGIMKGMGAENAKKLLSSAIKATDKEWNDIKVALIKGGNVKQAQCLDAARQSMKYMVDNGLVAYNPANTPVTYKQAITQESVANTPVTYKQANAYRF